MNKTVRVYLSPLGKEKSEQLTRPLGEVLTVVSLAERDRKVRFLVVDSFEKRLLVGNIFLIESNIAKSYATTAVHPHSATGNSSATDRFVCKLTASKKVKIPARSPTWVKVNFVTSCSADCIDRQ